MRVVLIEVPGKESWAYWKERDGKFITIDGEVRRATPDYAAARQALAANKSLQQIVDAALGVTGDE